jgi:plastocyanin
VSEESKQGTAAVAGAERGFVDRRKLLASMGAAGAVALAGCSSGSGQETPTDGTETDVGTTERTPADGDGASADGIDPGFGYTATAMDQEPPVEPDHTVALEGESRQGREIPEFYFEPAGLYVEPGVTAQFDLATPHHNVTAYHPALGYTHRVPDGVPAFSSAVLTAGSYWQYAFDRKASTTSCVRHTRSSARSVGSSSGLRPVPPPTPWARRRAASGPARRSSPRDSS